MFCRTMLANERQHKQELQECRQELQAANGRVFTLQDELAMVNSPAGILMKHKQQAEASLKVVPILAVSRTSMLWISF